MPEVYITLAGKWTCPRHHSLRAAVLLLLGGVFLYIFSGVAIDRSKKDIKTIKNHMKIDAVAPQAAADNLPLPPGHNG